MRDHFESGKIEWIGYGVSVRNLIGNVKKTVAYEELSSLDLPEELMSIDLARSNSDKRPKLEGLIETSGKNNGIILYSIDSLLVGSKNDGIEYYKWMLDIGLNLLVYDMSGRWPRLSEFSIDPEELEKDPVLKYRKLENLKEYYEKHKDDFLKRRINRKITAEFFLTDSPFKEIYYAYESYQIDLPTTMELLSEYCGINNVLTLRKLVQDYERTIIFPKEFYCYYTKNRFILDLPKRCGSIPDEYFELKNMIDEYKLKNVDVLDKINEEELFKAATLSTNIKCNYQIYRRWDLTYMKKPKPRKPVLRDFDINEFKKKFKSINE